MMTAFESDCLRCQKIGKPQKPCLKCGTSAGIREEYCLRCQHRFGYPVEDAVEPPQDAAAPKGQKAIIDREAVREIVKEVISSSTAAPVSVPQSHPGRITVMWLLSFIALIVFIGGGVGIGLLIDLIAVIIALTLVAARSSVDKGNGWVKLALEIVAFFVAYVNASSGYR